MEAAGGNTPQLGDLPQLSLGKNIGQKIHLNIFKKHIICPKICWTKGCVGICPAEPEKSFSCA